MGDGAGLQNHVSESRHEGYLVKPPRPRGHRLQLHFWGPRTGNCAPNAGHVIGEKVGKRRGVDPGAEHSSPWRKGACVGQRSRRIDFCSFLFVDSQRPRRPSRGMTRIHLTHALPQSYCSGTPRSTAREPLPRPRKKPIPNLGAWGLGRFLSQPGRCGTYIGALVLAVRLGP
ncbi:hypothetical protein K461DRAFT_171841 [Myriangium duriaei CBS 260.36]|uniref:Uncharacterized protein n=1 Tax=Myriangium duriaei CBS 260.36 TaxID=1168546 RepID=A0A9P4IZI3_9PEZI|nr:hypothetical protein K461DRAFT_171841 [Myriangium duriaei CBS 260.36]